MLKIRRPLGRLIFNMGIAIPGKTVFLIETAPSILAADSLHHQATSNNGIDYHQTSNISFSLVGKNKIFDHSDVVGASPVGTAPTTSSFST